MKESHTTHLDGNKIDPNSFTSDELLKHIYRQLQVMDAKMDNHNKDYSVDKIKQDEKITRTEMEIVRITTIVEQKDKSFKMIMTIIATGLTILSVILKFFV